MYVLETGTESTKVEICWYNIYGIYQYFERLCRETKYCVTYIDNGKNQNMPNLEIVLRLTFNYFIMWFISQYISHQSQLCFQL